MSLGIDPSKLVDVLKLESAFSQVLTLLNTMVTLETVAHLAEVEAEDMQIFANAMAERSLKADAVTARGTCMNTPIEHVIQLVLLKVNAAIGVGGSR